jgi:hypothetical protein
MTGKPKLNILYTEIGRGHPFYLDGIANSLENDFGDIYDINIANVFDISRGLIKRLWQLLNGLYKSGSQGGVIGDIYSFLRKRGSPNQYGVIERLLAKDIRLHILQNRYPTVVAHPMLVPVISDLVTTFYQHGEIAVPYQSAVKNCRTVFVPLEESKKEMIKNGVPANGISVSGLCIENELSDRAEKLYNTRLIRLQNNDILTGGFFSSGAEPGQHIESIINAIISLDKEGHKSIVFCRNGGKLASKLAGLESVSYLDSLYESDSVDEILEKTNILAVVYSNRSQENEFTGALFNYFDYIIAPSHERTNWAVGLGVPMFILNPSIGPFSPLNCAFLIDRGVAYKINSPADAMRFSSMLLNAKKSGSLVRTARNGYGQFPINGFKNIARYIANYLNEYSEQ